MSFFSDEIRCPLHAMDLANAISLLAERRDITGILHLAGPEAMSRADLAKWFARWLGLDPDLVRTATVAESATPRVARVVLDSSLAATLGFRARTISHALAD